MSDAQPIDRDAVSFTVNLAKYLLDREGEWVSVAELEAVGGRAWRTRVSDVRHTYGRRIENRVRRIDGSAISEYRAMPASSEDVAMPSVPVVEFPSRAMTEDEYRREREALRRTYGSGTAREAVAHADQALAALFVRTRWTQEQLAKAEGRSQPWVVVRLRFGHFLNFITTVINPELDVIKASLTEGRFRGFWALTAGNDRQRFLAVQKLLLESRDKHGQRKGLGAAIVETCADSKWHRLPTMTARVQAVDADATEAEVLAVLEGMVKHGWYGVFGEKAKGVAHNYRLVKKSEQSKWIEVNLLRTELTPILDGLKAEGRKNSVTASPGTVARLAGELERLIEKLVSEQPQRGFSKE